MYVILWADPDAEPILATRDARVVEAVLRAVVEIATPPDTTTAPAGGRSESEGARRGRAARQI